jgi:hypothetical protein
MKERWRSAHKDTAALTAAPMATLQGEKKPTERSARAIRESSERRYKDATKYVSRTDPRHDDVLPSTKAYLYGLREVFKIALSISPNSGAAGT